METEQKTEEINKKEQEVIELDQNNSKKCKTKYGSTAYSILKPRLIELINQRKTISEMAEELELKERHVQNMRSKVLREFGELTDYKIKTMKREFLVNAIEESKKMIEVIKNGLNAQKAIVLTNKTKDTINQEIEMVEDDRTKLDAVKTWNNFIKSQIELLGRYGILEPEVIRNKHEIEENTLKVIWGNNESNESKSNSNEDIKG